MKQKPVVRRCTRGTWSLGVIIALLSLALCAARPLALAVVEARASSDAPTDSGLRKTGLTYADRVAWRTQLKWPRDCEESFDYPDKSFAGLEFFELSPKRYLVQVTCTLGAYQGTFVFLFLDESRSPSASKLLTFVDWTDSGKPDRLQKRKATQLTGTPEFDPDKKLLRLTNKFRGIGDCGFLATYSLAKEQPELVLLQAKLECDGGASDPSEWKKMNAPY
jgi:hypothetical protein